MTQAVVQINEQGRIIIPARLRQELGLVPGSKLVAKIDGGRLVLEKPESILRQLRSTFNSSESVVDELIAERQIEAGRE